MLFPKIAWFTTQKIGLSCDQNQSKIMQKIDPTGPKTVKHCATSPPRQKTTLPVFCYSKITIQCVLKALCKNYCVSSRSVEYTLREETQQFCVCKMYALDLHIQRIREWPCLEAYLFFEIFIFTKTNFANFAILKMSHRHISDSNRHQNTTPQHIVNQLFSSCMLFR